MPLRENQRRTNYRPSKSSRAFLYKETHSRTQNSETPVTYYIIKFNDTAKVRGCHKNQSTDEEVIMKDVMYHKSHGINFVSRVPSDLSKIEKIVHVSPKQFTATITREPYTPVFSSQTSAGYKGNK